MDNQASIGGSIRPANPRTFPRFSKSNDSVLKNNGERVIFARLFKILFSYMWMRRF